MTLILQPGSVPLSTLETIYWTGEPPGLIRPSTSGIEKAAARIAEIAARQRAGLRHQHRLR